MYAKIFSLLLCSQSFFVFCVTNVHADSDTVIYDNAMVSISNTKDLLIDLEQKTLAMRASLSRLDSTLVLAVQQETYCEPWVKIAEDTSPCITLMALNGQFFAKPAADSTFCYEIYRGFHTMWFDNAGFLWGYDEYGVLFKKTDRIDIQSLQPTASL